MGRYTQEEVALASRNSGMPLEALRYDLTPAGLHYLLIHFDIPATEAADWELRIAGLVPAEAMRDEVLLAYAMNGQALLPQHGAPLRLVVPGWYGMASVKWLERVEAIGHAFDGVQQARSYHFKSNPGEQGTPCTRMRVNSLMVPPGIPEYYGRRRVLDAGPAELLGRAWSGDGAVTRVEISVDGAWQDAILDSPAAPHAWQRWTSRWLASPGVHELRCRATGRSGARQPLEPVWDLGGFGNNAAQRVEVVVR